jgi:electron transfer flavoprotein alpha subunit
MRVLALTRRGGAVPTAIALGETTAVALVPPEEEGVLAAARAAGAIRAVALWAPELADTDYLGLAQVLAAVARHLGFDLIVAGEGARGAVGPAVAERLALPHLSGVADAVLDEGQTIVRRRAGERIWRYRATPPALLCVSGPPLPPESGASVERIDLATVGIVPAELAWRKRFRPRPAPGPESQPRRFPDAATLAARLIADGLVGARRSG